jgi:hypothetical protein
MFEEVTESGILTTVVLTEYEPARMFLSCSHLMWAHSHLM